MSNENVLSAIVATMGTAFVAIVGYFGITKTSNNDADAKETDAETERHKTNTTAESERQKLIFEIEKAVLSRIKEHMLGMEKEIEELQGQVKTLEIELKKERKERKQEREASEALRKKEREASAVLIAEKERAIADLKRRLEIREAGDWFE